MRLRTILILCLIGNALHAQPVKLIDELFQEYANTPGLVVAIYEKGKISFSKGYGLADLDYNIPITSQTVFDVGSMSKQFTAACIFLLEQQGKLSIDDPIQKFLPEIPAYNGDRVTIRHLVNHTSGLRDYVEIMNYAGIPFGNVFTESMGLDIMARQKEVNFRPGEKFMYNNGGYMLLAIIVRRTSGMSIGEYAEKNIFGPLGMTHSFILEDPDRIVSNSATGYVKRKDGQFARQHFYNFAIGGDGQVYTSVEDLLKWDNNFYDYKVGGKDLQKRLHERGILNNGDTIAYAGGLFIEKYKGQRVVQHSGSWGGFRSMLYRLPDLHISLVTLANYPGTALPGKVPKIVDELIPASSANSKSVTSTSPTKKAPKISPKKLTQWTGEYEAVGQEHKHYAVSLDRDTLRVKQLWNAETFSLVSVTTTLFSRKDIQAIQFAFDEVTPGKMQVRDRLETFMTTRVQPFDIATVKDVSEYAGEYFSEEVNATYVLKAEGAKLVYFLKGEPQSNALAMVRTDVFGISGMGFIFKRSPAGSVDEFSLQDRRIRNLKFKKVK
ncbi:MAG: beta-lactamase family protein [Cyclobacteriaceae bacterium]|nr:beta-lactamase family protein [Cyclobacteriaceae bacterium]